MGAKRVGRPALWKLLTEGWRAVAHIPFNYAFMEKIQQAAPKGDGHTVLLFPGFGAPNASMYSIKKLCKGLGYNVKPWNTNIKGWNLGPNPWVFPEEFRNTLEIAEKELIEHFEETGKKASIIGQSLGGVYASLLARKHPDKVRSIITLGSPIQMHNHPESVAFAADIIFKFLNPESDLIDSEEVAQIMDEPSPVPTTHIYSKWDGVVNWKAAISSDKTRSKTTEDVEVFGAHLAQGLNPQSLIVIGDRLSQPDNKRRWKPFYRTSYEWGFFKSTMAHEKQRFAWPNPL